MQPTETRPRTPERLGRVAAHAAITGLLALLAGCGPGPREDRVMLVDHAKWTEVDAAGDPFEDRPDVVACAPEGWGPAPLDGEASLRLETRRCRYLTVRQESKAELRRGEQLRIRLVHLQLSAPEPAEAHVGVQIGGGIRWSARVGIPRDAGVVTGELPVDRFVPAGVPIVFHLHDQGENSWNLVELSTGSQTASVAR